MSVFDFLHPDFSFLTQSKTNLGSAILVMGELNSGSLLFALDFVLLGPVPLPHSFACFDLPVSTLNHARFGFPLSIRSMV